MSFRKNAIVTVQRKASTRSAMGGQANAWAPYVWNADTGDTTTGLPCAYWPSGRNENESNTGQPLGVNHYQFAFETDYGIQIGDRIILGDQDFQVVGDKNPYGGTSTVYIINAVGKVL